MPTVPTGATVNDTLVPGRRVDLPGRGSTWVHDLPGPGDGASTLVLLHGWTATAALNWFPVLLWLGRRYRVVALDLRGHGRGIRSRVFRLEDCADDVAALADHLGIRSFIPVGYSMGGTVTQLLWHRHREMVEGMVLCATSRNFRGSPEERIAFSALPVIAGAAGLVPLAVRDRVARSLMTSRSDDAPWRQWVMAEVRRSDPVAILQAGRALGRFSSHKWIGGVDVPTAIVVTTEDSLVPVRRQLKLAESIPKATVHPVQGNHGVCVLNPERFAPVLLEACQSVTRRTKGMANGRMG